MKWIKATERLPLDYTPTQLLVMRIKNQVDVDRPKIPWVGTFDVRENAFYPDMIDPFGPSRFDEIEWLDDTEVDMSKVTRFEVINHKTNHNSFGRAFTDYDVNSIELDFQDNNRTLKVFLS